MNDNRVSLRDQSRERYSLPLTFFHRLISQAGRLELFRRIVPIRGRIALWNGWPIEVLADGPRYGRPRCTCWWPGYRSPLTAGGPI